MRVHRHTACVVRRSRTSSEGVHVHVDLAQELRTDYLQDEMRVDCSSRDFASRKDKLCLTRRAS
eukprot:6183083-Pleurochrysis_carterae.AAC.2